MRAVSVGARQHLRRAWRQGLNHRDGALSRPVAVCFGGAALLMAFVLRTSAAQPPDAAPPELQPDELVAMWDAQRTEVVTASIRCLCFNSSTDGSDITSPRLAELIRDHDLTAGDSELRPFLEQILAKSLDGHAPWVEMEVKVSGRRLRQDEPEMTFLRDGEHEFVVLPSNRQVTIYQPGQSGIAPYGLDDLRWTPPAPMTADRIRVTAGDEGASRVEFLPRPGQAGDGLTATAIVDSATGVVTYKGTHGADGAPLKERFQLGIKSFPGDIHWPTAAIEARYAQGRLTGLRVLLLSSAQFNQSVPDSDFVLSAGKGTTVIDHRAAATTGTRLESDAADLRAVIGPVQQSRLPAGAASGDNSVRRLLLWLNAVCFLAAGFWFWRSKRSRVHPRNSSPSGTHQ